MSKISNCVIWRSCSQSLHLLHTWPWFSSLWNLFMQFSRNCRVCMWIGLTTTVHVSAQKWQCTGKAEPCKSSNGGGKNPTAINTLDHAIVRGVQVRCTSPSLHPSSSLASGNVVRNLYTDSFFLPVLLKPALMSCTPCRNCQVFLCPFTKPTYLGV